MSKLILKIAIPVVISVFGVVGGLIFWRKRKKTLPWYRRIVVVPIVKY